VKEIKRDKPVINQKVISFIPNRFQFEILIPVIGTNFNTPMKNK
jgi:hypothetical protein